jgi:uncharacterized repeat protein (TIGR04138 family)
MPAEKPVKSLQDVADAVGLYPIEAFEFVQRGLSYTVSQIHGSVAVKEAVAGKDIEARHVSGQQLCMGLRDYALLQWGMLARTVLERWNITSTLDFGRIVFSLVEHEHLRTTEGDSIEDFRNVYDFRSAFESGYRIECKT